jgi:hypothetical protein
MNKTDLLLQMMESPQDYTAAEWQEILADDECRELYTLMAKMQSTMDAARSEERATDEMIDAEWHQLRPVASNHSMGFYKIAAMIISVAMLSGIAYAAICMVQQHQQPTGESALPTGTVRPVSRDVVSEPADTIVAPQPVLYDNVPLEQILADVSTYYHMKEVYRDDAARHYRLFYQWRPEYSLQTFVEMLNNFEALQLLLENDTLFVSSSEKPQS